MNINFKLANLTILLLFFIALPAQSYSQYYFPSGVAYDVCFSPKGQCTQKIVQLIEQAKREILVQAYSFTSAPIARELVIAHKRGVDVKVILDKSQVKNNKYSSSRFLANNHIPVWIDYKPAIAHSKVMLFDNAILETGSFNGMVHKTVVLADKWA